MATWEKVKFYWSTMLGSTGSTLTATSTLSGTAVANIYNMLEGDRWEATDTTSPQYLTYDAGVGNTATVDYLAVLLHNLSTAGATLALEASNDNFTTTVVMDAFVPSVDTVLLRELTYLQNEGFEVWDGGLPAGWIKNIGTETLAVETTIVKSGSSSVKITNTASSQGGCQQNIEDKTIISFWQSKVVSFGAWVYATDVNRVRVAIYDGIATSYSAYHTGGGGWEFLSITRTIDNAATALHLFAPLIDTGTAITAYADSAILKIASSVLSTDTNEPFDAANQTLFRYTQLNIGGTLTAAPKAALAIWGLKTELDYARASYDPNAEEVKANINVGDTGYLLGIHRRYSERSMNLKFSDADAALYAKVKAWWEGSGLNNFFVAWEHANSPDDVFLMHPDVKFSNPLTNGGAFRDVSIKLKGRKE